jgi:hypothetical protein
LSRFYPRKLGKFARARSLFVVIAAQPRSSLPFRLRAVYVRTHKADVMQDIYRNNCAVFVTQLRGV